MTIEEAAQVLTDAGWEVKKPGLTGIVEEPVQGEIYWFAYRAFVREDVFDADPVSSVMAKHGRIFYDRQSALARVIHDDFFVTIDWRLLEDALTGISNEANFLRDFCWSRNIEISDKKTVQFHLSKIHDEIVCIMELEYS